jgi:O-antigen/teichoic acid export membrane protein
MAFLSFTLAYIGPGMGGGFIAAVVGILISIFLALFAILWYPFKKLIEKFKNKKED